MSSIFKGFHLRCGIQFSFCWQALSSFHISRLWPLSKQVLNHPKPRTNSPISHRQLLVPLTICHWKMTRVYYYSIINLLSFVQVVHWKHWQKKNEASGESELSIHQSNISLLLLFDFREQFNPKEAKKTFVSDVKFSRKLNLCEIE